ncbi:MAG: aldehyde dehydrogenase family protein [Halioglobus sp.]
MAQTAQIAQFPSEPENEAQRVLQAQRQAYLDNPYPSLEERLDNLLKLERLLVEHQEEIARAISEDFGNRSVEESKLLELFLSIDGIRYARKRLKKWMKPQRRGVSIWFAGGRNRLLAQPKGVVGIVVPWNYPLFLAIGPLTNSRPGTDARSRSRIRAIWPPCSTSNGGGNFERIHAGNPARRARLGFYHLPFRDIHRLRPTSGARSCGQPPENLTPVTLELGGKSPIHHTDDFDIDWRPAASFSPKLMNAGQTSWRPISCTCPNPNRQNSVEPHALLRNASPTFANGQFTTVIDDASFSRLTDTLADAEGGARVDQPYAQIPADASAVFAAAGAPPRRRDKIMREDLRSNLAVRTYRDIDGCSAISIGASRPLGCTCSAMTRRYRGQGDLLYTLSAGSASMTAHSRSRNDTPFGGIEASGMGHWSRARGVQQTAAIFSQFRFSALPLLYPPYGLFSILSADDS